MCKILTIANQKGGVSKTSTALNLAHALGLQGKRVLALDLDPQSSLTVCFGVENHEHLETTMHDLMLTVLNDEPLPPKESYIISKGNVDLIPCNIGLSAIEDKLREEAMLIVTETNLIQRSFADLAHSEKAIALKTHMDAIKAQGKRTDIIDEVNSLLNADKNRDKETCALLGNKSKSIEKIGAKYDLSKNSVARYIRISSLDVKLIKRVDNSDIGLYPAVSLSYLSADEQTELDFILDSSSYKIDMKKAEALRGLSAEKKLTNDKMTAVLSGELSKKPKPKTSPPLRIKHKVYSKHFNETVTQKEMEEIIDKALTEYFNNHKEEKGDEQ